MAEKKSGMGYLGLSLDGFTTDKLSLLHGDSLKILPELEDACVDSIVTDPPAGISFMGKDWDSDKGGRDEWIKAMAKIFGEVLHVLKPGGHALVWALPRTSHWTATALEDAGFEIRDVVTHLFGSGFPKSLDIGKAIDKRGGATADFSQFREAVLAGLKIMKKSRKDLEKKLGNYMLSHYLTAGSQPAIPSRRDYLIIRDYLLMDDTFDPLFLEEAEREVVGHKDPGLDKGSGKTVDFKGSKGRDETGKVPITISSSDEAKKFEGWGTSLKPASEHWILARKPCAEPTVAANVLKHGTGGINIDGCRIATPDSLQGSGGPPLKLNGENPRPFHENAEPRGTNRKDGGRWPANVILSHNSDCVCKGTKKGPGYAINKFTDGAKPFGGGAGHPYKTEEREDVIEIWECSEGCAVALLDAQSGESGSTIDRNLSEDATSSWFAKEHMRQSRGDFGGASRFFYVAKPSRTERNDGVGGNPDPVTEHNSRPRDNEDADWKKRNGNFHPTVKPVELMRYLCKLLTPKGGTVLDPFMGSGSTAIGAYEEGFSFIGIEKDLEYFQISVARVKAATAQQKLFV